MAAMLRDSVTVVVRTRPLTIPRENQLMGLLFFPIWYGAPLGGQKYNFLPNFLPALHYIVHFFSDTKDCESVKDEVSVSDESERCESSTSADDKEESGIEQDFDPSTAGEGSSSKTNESTTELRKKPSKSEKAPEMPPVPLIPINLKSHLKRNDRIKTFTRISKSVPGTMEQSERSCDSSPEKCASFVPSNNIKKQFSPYRAQYSRGCVGTPSRQPRRKKVPEMFGDIIIKDRIRGRSQTQSPARRGILKYPSSSRSATLEVKYAATPKKNKVKSSKGMPIF